MGFFANLVKGTGKLLGVAANLLTGGGNSQPVVVQGFLPSGNVNIPGVGSGSVGGGSNSNSPPSSGTEWYKQPFVIIGGIAAFLLIVVVSIVSLTKRK